DGIWQDGALLIHFENADNENENKWVGIFLAFQSQSWCTDEQGHAIKPPEECNHTGEKLDFSGQCPKKERNNGKSKGNKQKKKK
ncbi:DUF2278 family protein, partial [Bacillus wiedmannii]|uniref:DUF2278 family protein n=1 Tax=Bacillus wiedmannii TaxID=1890302 RepID=UPI0010BD3CDA